MCSFAEMTLYVLSMLEETPRLGESNMFIHDIQLLSTSFVAFALIRRDNEHICIEIKINTIQ